MTLSNIAFQPIVALFVERLGEKLLALEAAAVAKDFTELSALAH